MSRSSTRVIVVGSNAAAYICARVLASQVDRVVVIEPADRPQADATDALHQPLWMLARADRDTLDRWFPMLTDELAATAAAPDTAVLGVDPSRLTAALRRRLLYQRPGVTLDRGAGVQALQMDHRGHVIGVVADGEAHLANLVVDCMGPHTPLLGDLPRAGFEVPDLAVRFSRSRPVRRRHAERLRRVPAGYIAAGDTLCTLDAWQSEAVRLAVMQGCALAGAARRHGIASARTARAFYRRAAGLIDEHWHALSLREARVPLRGAGVVR